MLKCYCASLDNYLIDKASTWAVTPTGGDCLSMKAVTVLDVVNGIEGPEHEKWTVQLDWGAVT